MKRVLILTAAAFLGLASCEKEKDPNCYTGEIIQGGSGVVYDSEYNFVEEEILYVDNCSGDTLSFTVYDACDAHGWRVKGSVTKQSLNDWRNENNIGTCENN